MVIVRLLVGCGVTGCGLTGCGVAGSGRVVARRAVAPVDDLGFIDHEAGWLLGRGEARCVADGAVHVDDQTAGAADQVVVVVSDAYLEQGR